MRARHAHRDRFAARVQQPQLARRARQQHGFVAHPRLRLDSRRAAHSRQRARRRVHVRQHLDVRPARQLEPPVALARSRASLDTLLRTALLEVRRVELLRRVPAQRQPQPLVGAVRRVERVDLDLRRLRRPVHHPHHAAPSRAVRRRREQRHPVQAAGAPRHAPGRARQHRSVQQQVRRVRRSPLRLQHQPPLAGAVTQRSRQSRRRPALQLRRRVAARLPRPKLHRHLSARMSRVVDAPHGHRCTHAARVRQPQHAARPRFAAGVEQRQLDLARHQRRVVQRRQKTFRPRVRPRLDVQLRRQFQTPVPLARPRPRQPRRRVSRLHRRHLELDRRARVQRQPTRLHSPARVVHRHHANLTGDPRPALDPHHPRVPLRRRRRQVRHRVRLLRAPGRHPHCRRGQPRQHMPPRPCDGGAANPPAPGPRQDHRRGLRLRATAPRDHVCFTHVPLPVPQRRASNRCHHEPAAAIAPPMPDRKLAHEPRLPAERLVAQPAATLLPWSAASMCCHLDCLGAVVVGDRLARRGINAPVVAPRNYSMRHDDVLLPRVERRHLPTDICC